MVTYKGDNLLVLDIDAVCFRNFKNEINDLLDKYQPDATLRQLTGRLEKEKSDIGEKTYHDIPYNITAIYDNLVDTLNTVAGYPVERSGVFSGNLEEYEEFFNNITFTLTCCLSRFLDKCRI